MFPLRYFNPRYWAARYWPKIGADPPVSTRIIPISGRFVSPIVVKARYAAINALAARFNATIPIKGRSL